MDDLQETPRSAALKLFLLGFLTLFLELALIRFLAGNVWNLGYFPNLVLLAVFVGMGAGFVFHQHLGPRGSQRCFLGSSLLLLLLVTLVTQLHPTLPGFQGLSGEVGGDLYFSATPEEADSSPWLFLLWFLTTLAVFALLSQRTAKLFSQFAPLRAYTLDIMGSCAGIVAFSLCSWLQLPPAVWFLAVGVLYVAAGPPRPTWLRAAPAGALAVVIALAVASDQPRAHEKAPDGEVHWSPYQKLELAPYADGGGDIFANGISHQSMRSLSNLAESFYRIPHEARKRVGEAPYRRVLIIGAGSGNDVFAALQNGAESVHAVDIDPAIVDIGRRWHPGKPYSDSRVKITVDDGRAVMTRSKERFDLIVFALTDSLVKVSSRSQLRLENYLFTRESIERAYQLLADGGDLVLYNYYREDWLLEKLRRTLELGTGQAPRSLAHSEHFDCMTVRKAGGTRPPPGPGIEVASDDWPFLYMRQRGISSEYLAAMATVGVLVLLLIGGVLAGRRGEEGPSQPLPLKLAFALMGVAFLLLETKSVIQFSLLFGTTWLNNSLVFLGILLLVLAANWLAQLDKAPSLRVIFVLLLGSCGVTLVYPLADLLQIESTALRFLVASLLTFSPIFFANLLFSVAFRSQQVAEHLFGWNLIGATLGGAVEYTSLALGYNALAWIVAGCYAGAYLCLRLGAVNEDATSPSPAPAQAPPETPPPAADESAPSGTQ